MHPILLYMAPPVDESTKSICQNWLNEDARCNNSQLEWRDTKSWNIGLAETSGVPLEFCAWHGH